MRVLDISQSYLSDEASNIAGIHVHRQNLRLRDKGWDIRVVNPQPMFYRSFSKDIRFLRFRSERDGIPIWRPRYFWLPLVMRHGSIWLDRFYALSVFNALDEISANWKPDLIVGDWLLPSGLAAERVAKHFQVPLILKSHGHDVRWIAKAITVSERYRKYYRAIISAAEHVINNGAGLHKLMQQTDLVDPHKLHCIPIGVDTDHFCPVASQERRRLRDILALPSDACICLFVGRWEVAKGTKELTHALERLMPRFPDMYVVAIGPIHDHPRKKQLEEGFDRVHILGPVEPHQVEKFMQASDLLVLPSHAEGLPSTILEAMACSLPVIASPVGGIPAIVRNEENGLLVEVGDVDALEAAIANVVQDAGLRERLGIAARQTVLSEGYDLAAVADALHEVLSSCLST